MRESGIVGDLALSSRIVRVVFSYSMRSYVLDLGIVSISGVPSLAHRSLSSRDAYTEQQAVDGKTSLEVVPADSAEPASGCRHSTVTQERLWDTC